MCIFCYKICSSTILVVTCIARLVVSQLARYGEAWFTNPTLTDDKASRMVTTRGSMAGISTSSSLGVGCFQRELPSRINDHIAIAGSFPLFFHHFSRKETYGLKVWVHFTAGLCLVDPRKPGPFQRCVVFFGRASNPARDSSHNQVRLADKRKTGGFQTTPSRWWFLIWKVCDVDVCFNVSSPRVLGSFFLYLSS